MSFAVALFSLFISFQGALGGHESQLIAYAKLAELATSCHDRASIHIIRKAAGRFAREISASVKTKAYYQGQMDKAWEWAERAQLEPFEIEFLNAEIGRIIGRPQERTGLIEANLAALGKADPQIEAWFRGLGL